MNSTKQISYTLDQLPQVAQQIVALTKQYPIIAISGTLGAGKTTLVQAVLNQLGITGVLTSPTFNYVNIYQSADKTIYHFDLYRIKSVQEFLVAGFDEYIFDPQGISIIEWPEVIAPLLTKNCCFITIDYDGPDARMMTISIKGAQ